MKAKTENEEGGCEEERNNLIEAIGVKRRKCRHRRGIAGVALPCSPAASLALGAGENALAARENEIISGGGACGEKAGASGGIMLKTLSGASRVWRKQRRRACWRRRGGSGGENLGVGLKWRQQSSEM